MRRRFVLGAGLVTSLAIAGVLTLGAGTSATASAAAAAPTVDGCQIIADPSSTYYTTCPNADLSGADLQSADLQYADLAHANLMGANLSSATLTDADLSEADLTQAVLSNAKLQGAHLVGVDLSGQNLSGTDFTKADLTGADLTNSILKGTTWSAAHCPDGSPSSRVGNTCVNDLLVLEGAAIGSSSSGSALATNGQGSNSGSNASSLRNFSALAFTGANVKWLAFLGVALVAAGLFMVLAADPVKRRHLRRGRS
jgi:uncharacterized protein YjbI with pentapeptide repeats